MGRNRDLRRKIAGRERVVEEHEKKVRRELTKLEPDELLIAHWQREIENWKRKILHLTRRLKREW
jgi:hypothetical protein